MSLAEAMGLVVPDLELVALECGPCGDDGRQTWALPPDESPASVVCWRCGSPLSRECVSTAAEVA